ncbi:MAG TPA: hydrolase [Anaerolineales bacterium]|nr:hydrolase [Anaerolineales bacterium]
MNFTLQPFHPPRVLSAPHVQTILPHFLRTGRGVMLRRERITLPDGDFLDLDFADWNGVLPQEQSSCPLVLLLHGLEGGSHSGYISESTRQLAGHGLRAVALNHRGCSGEPNRTPRAYHSGETGDLAFVIEWLAVKFPDTPLAAFGFSLGANMLLKYLGENGENTPLKVAAAVSPPFDLGRGSDRMAQGFNQVYTQTFLRRLKRKTVAKAKQYRKLMDLPTVMAARTLREFDNAFVAPVYSFRDADDYYARSSSGQFLAGIRISTLIIRSKDDPFFDPSDIPYDVLHSNPCLTPAVTEKGGHVGFMEGFNRYWAEREAARFLVEKLNADSMD